MRKPSARTRIPMTSRRRFLSALTALAAVPRAAPAAGDIGRLFPEKIQQRGLRTED